MKDLICDPELFDLFVRFINRSYYLLNNDDSDLQSENYEQNTPND